MRFSGHVSNAPGKHTAEVAVGARSTVMSIAPKAAGGGSSISGGELPMLALATCYCNDVYREAAKTSLEIEAVDVECSADFEAEGAPATNITYTAKITARAPESAIRDLAARVDRLAEIQNSIRAAIPVKLLKIEAIPL